MFHIPTT